MDAEWGGVVVTITAGELGVDELQLDVLDEESKGTGCPLMPVIRWNKSIEFEGSLCSTLPRCI